MRRYATSSDFTLQSLKNLDRIDTRPTRVTSERSLNLRCACAMTERRFQRKEPLCLHCCEQQAKACSLYCWPSERSLSEFVHRTSFSRKKDLLLPLHSFFFFFFFLVFVFFFLFCLFVFSVLSNSLHKWPLQQRSCVLQPFHLAPIT